jgi:hypothetical protein
LCVFVRRFTTLLQADSATAAVDVSEGAHHKQAAAAYRGKPAG